MVNRVEEAQDVRGIKAWLGDGLPALFPKGRRESETQESASARATGDGSGSGSPRNFRSGDHFSKGNKNGQS